MLRTSVLSVLLLAPAIWAIPIGAGGTADALASATAAGSEAVATASAVGGRAISSATASAFGSVSTSSLSPNQFGAFEIAPVVQSAQIGQSFGVAPSYQTFKRLPVVQHQLPAYGAVYGKGLGSFGLAGGAFGGFSGGFGRYRESYRFRSRGFSGGLGGFAHYGSGGRRFKAHYSSGGVAAVGLAGLGGGFVGGGGAALG